MKKQHPKLKVLNRMLIYRLVRKFEGKGTISDTRHNSGIGRPRSVRTKENIDAIDRLITETPQKSVRRVLHELDCNVSKSSVHRILKFDLKLIPYKISVMQHLKETDIRSRLEFAHWILSRPDSENLTDAIWFSDEAHFHLNNVVNKQNFRFWGSAKPNFYVEKPHNCEKVTVWAALSSTGIIGPFFFEDTEGEAVTVNSERYLKLMKSKFLPALRRKVVNFDDVWFQQDGATPHTAGCVLQWLDNTFGDQYISYRTANVWPPHSPDLNPLDFFLWGYLKDRVYSPSPQTTEDLKQQLHEK